MFRASLSVLLIVNLLACPARCVACDVVDTANVVEAPPACCCCSHDAQVPASNFPVDESEDDCHCQNCICEGATLQSGFVLPESAPLVAFVDDQRRLQSPQQQAVRKLVHRADHHFLDGRSVRIAHQSWQI